MRSLSFASRSLVGAMIDEGCAVSVLRSGQDVSVLLGILSTPGQDKAGVVTAAGVVSSRRELKSVIFLIVQLTEDSQTTDGQVQLVFDAAAISIPAIESCVAHARAGAHISFTGVPRADRPDSLSIYVTGITLLQCSSEPEAIKRFVLSTLSANNDNPPAASVCSILSCEPPQLATLQQLASAGSSKAKEFKQAVAKHSRVMVGKPSRRSRQREHRVARSDLEVLERAERTVGLWNQSEIDEDGAGQEDSVVVCGECSDTDNADEGGLEANAPELTQGASDASSILNVPDGRADLPSARGSMSRGEYMHGRKQPQIRWFARRMRTMGEFHHVLDIGGGRGDLAVHIAQSFPHVHVTVVDANVRSLLQGQRFAESFGPGVAERIRFVCTRVTEEMDFSKEGILASSLAPTAEDSTGNVNAAQHLSAVDFVVALHACGGLSDLALRCAVQNKCKFLVCPCCYLKTPFVLPVAPRQTNARSEEDASRDGAFSASDAQQLNAEDRQTLLRLAESDNRTVSLRASHVINSARMHALQSMLPPHQPSTLRLHLFAEEFSLRNMVLALS